MTNPDQKHKRCLCLLSGIHCWQQYFIIMSKFKKEFTRLKPNECNFFFYTTSGSWGMYCKQIRHYWFCIPFLFGFRYTVSWGSDW